MRFHPRRTNDNPQSTINYFSFNVKSLRIVSVRSIAYNHLIGSRSRGMARRESPRENCSARCPCVCGRLGCDIYTRDSIERGVVAREPVGQRFCVHLQLTGLSADCARRNRRAARACSAYTFLVSLLHVFLSSFLLKIRYILPS